MRADRLLALLMLLQTRGRMTAQQLADELEVSLRTVYRDVDALSMAGVPVYAERGPGGGCALLDSYRTNLTGLNEDEVRALFMLSIPAPLAELGVGRELKAAMRKLVAALPAAHRSDEERVRQRIHLDWSGWDLPNEPAPHLQTVQRAVWEDRRLHLVYRRVFDTVVERLVDPYGLVAKAGAWHLVCAVGGDAVNIHVHRVSRLLEARLSEERFERPAAFDLGAFWQAWCAAHAQNRPVYPVTLRVSPALVRELPWHFGESVRDLLAQAGPPDAGGWITLTLPFESLADARARILGLGRAVEVLEPEALRHSVVDFAAQIVAFYAQAGGA